MIELEAKPGYVVLPVKATPGARTTEVRGIREGQLLVNVTQVAEKGKANKAIIQVLSKTLHLKKSQLVLLSGSTSAQKRFAVRDIALDQLRARIEAIASAT